MKKLKISTVIVLCSFVSSCIIVGSYDSPMNFNSDNVVLILDTKDCKFVEKIAPIRKIWAKTDKDISMFEVNRLKAMAYRGGANSITNVVILSQNDPIGNADSYSCPDNIFKSAKLNQNNSEYIKKVITVK